MCECACEHLGVKLTLHNDATQCPRSVSTCARAYCALKCIHAWRRYYVKSTPCVCVCMFVYVTHCNKNEIMFRLLTDRSAWRNGFGWTFMDRHRTAHFTAMCTNHFIHMPACKSFRCALSNTTHTHVHTHTRKYRACAMQRTRTEILSTILPGGPRTRLRCEFKGFP